MEPITSISLVIKGFLDKMKLAQSDLIFVFDPGLDYQEAMTGVRSYRTQLYQNTDSKTVPFPSVPCLAWNREPLKPQDDLGQRRNARVYGQKIEVSPGKFDIPAYWYLGSQITFRMLFITNDPTELETFELLYATEHTISGIRDFYVTYPIIGQFQYSVTWTEIEDIVFNKMDNVYMTAGFSCTLRGPQILFLENYPAISEINFEIRKFNTSIWSDPKNILLSHSKIDKIT